MQFYKLERSINLTEGYRQTFTLNHRQYLLIQESGQTHIILNQCPHQQKALGEQCVHQNVVRCPWHGIEYDIISGTAITEGKQGLRLQKLMPSYEGAYTGLYLDQI